MKKKWLQGIISMVLAVGMLMPSVGAYAEIIDHPTNYKTATSMPMYDNPEIQITEGEYIVEEIVDGSEISSLSNEHKYLATFAVRNAYQGSFTFIKPSSGY